MEARSQIFIHSTSILLIMPYILAAASRVLVVPLPSNNLAHHHACMRRNSSIGRCRALSRKQGSGRTLPIVDACTADGMLLWNSRFRFNKGVFRRFHSLPILLQTETSLASCGIMVRHPSFLNVTSTVRGLRGGDSRPRNNSTMPNHSPNIGEQQWRRAYLAVGSNLGDRYQNIADALSRLISSNPSTIRVTRTSFLRITAPMYVTDQPEFLNGAVEVETTLSPLELLRTMKRIETELGRDIGPNSQAVRYGPRPVDLDIILFDEYAVRNDLNSLEENFSTPLSMIMQTEELEIPHPRMSEREFVLSPMADLEGRERNITHPVSNKTMSELLSSLQNKSNETATNKYADHPAVRVLPLPRGRMVRFNKTIIMGILNVTPDSFSDGGKYYSHSSAEMTALHHATQLVRDGADILDIGGESTRPGAEDVAVQEELKRVIPIIQRIRQEEELSNIPISIDTRNSDVARAAIVAGADIVNDVSGGTHDPEMFATVASLSVPMIIMHMRGNPKTMQSLTDYSSGVHDEGGGSNGEVVSVVARELMQRSAAAEAAGIPRWLQIVDPGIGFSKDMHGNLSLLKGVHFLRRYCDNLPFLFGPSRKGFIGKITGEKNPEDRDYGTIAACLASIQSSSGDCEMDEACKILRVHNVKAVKQAVMVFDAIQGAE